MLRLGWSENDQSVYDLDLQLRLFVVDKMHWNCRPFIVTFLGRRTLCISLCIIQWADWCKNESHIKHANISQLPDGIWLGNRQKTQMSSIQIWLDALSTLHLNKLHIKSRALDYTNSSSQATVCTQIRFAGETQKCRYVLCVFCCYSRIDIFSGLEYAFSIYHIR